MLWKRLPPPIENSWGGRLILKPGVYTPPPSSLHTSTALLVTYSKISHPIARFTLECTNNHTRHRWRNVYGPKADFVIIYKTLTIEGHNCPCLPGCPLQRERGDAGNRIRIPSSLATVRREIDRHTTFISQGTLSPYHNLSHLEILQQGKP